MDTCCKHWSMQINSDMLEKYKKDAPQLLAAVEPDNDGSLQNPHVGFCDQKFIMLKDKQTNYCVKLEDGKCGIHKEYGEKFLGDACYFYPRITRNIGDAAVMSATMSCPEIARIALYGEQPFTLEETEFSRLPQEIKNILPEGMPPEDALAIHSDFISATQDESASAEHIFARINSVSRSLHRIEKKDWLRAAPMYFRLADGSLPQPEMNINDPFNLLHSLCGLVVASKKSIPPRLQQTITEIEQALCVTLDWQNILIQTSDASLPVYNKLYLLWKDQMQEIYSPLLKRWLAAQLSSSLYPFAGLGDSLPDRITIIGVRMAILRLALISAYSIKNGELHQDDVVRVVQSLSRFLDHLANPVFSLQIYTETGWDKESRMRGLLN